METVARVRSTILTVLPLLVLAAGWLLLAPAQLGGSAGLVIVDGESMRPSYGKGDLVIVHRTGSYAVGDVAAYEHPDLGPVFHRIVERQGPTYVLRGDANTWLDSHQPTDSEMVGRAWLRLPAAGRLVDQLRSGPGLLILCFALGVLLVNLFRTCSGARRRRAGSLSDRNRRPPRVPGGSSNVADGAASALAAVLLVGVVLGSVAFTRPTEVPSPAGAEYEHVGAFDYSADAPTGLYDTERVRTGQPIFRRLTEQVDLQFRYRLDSEHSADQVDGRYRLLARISDPATGWNRSMQLRPDTAFSDGAFTAAAQLDLDRVEKLVAALERRTGVHGERYALTFVPRVVLEGTLGNRALEETFAPELGFWVDSLHLQLQASAVDGAGGSDASSLRPVRPGTAGAGWTEPNTVDLLGLGLAVATARYLAAGLVLFALAGLVLVTVPVLRGLRGDEPSRIHARYRHLLVRIEAAPADDRGEAVEVSTFADLAKLAAASDHSILHEESEGGHAYYVRTTDTTYRYAAATRGRSPQIGSPSPLLRRASA